MNIIIRNSRDLFLALERLRCNDLERAEITLHSPDLSNNEIEKLAKALEENITLTSV